MRFTLHLFVAGLLCASSLFASPATILQNRIEQLIHRYAPEYDEARPDDPPPFGLRATGYESFKSVALRKKSSQAYGDIVAHHTIWIHAYSYPDKDARDKALEKWFHCFGSLCDPLLLKNGAGFTKSPPLLAVANDTEIFVLVTRCETLGPEWDRNKRDFEERFGSAGQIRIEVEECSGKVSVTPKDQNHDKPHAR
jgi:hypothetical protein